MDTSDITNSLLQKRERTGKDYHGCFGVLKTTIKYSNESSANLIVFTDNRSI